MNLGLHILKNPTGTYTFVGSVPASLCEEVDATQSDVMGGRAYRADDGSLKTPKVPSFPSYEEARQFAREHGFEPID